MGPLAFAECYPVQSNRESSQQPNVITVENRLSVQAVQHHTARGHGQLPPPNYIAKNHLISSGSLISKRYRELQEKNGNCHSATENISGPGPVPNFFGPSPIPFYLGPAPGPGTFLS